MMDLINLYSDTQTLPTEEMYKAMRTAPLGDDISDTDPTVHELESLAAKMTGKEAAMLTISGSMANLVALMAHANPGDEVLVDRDAHIFYYEGGSMASVAGLMPMPQRSDRGLLDPDEISASIRKRDIHHPIPRLLCLENTHNRGAGRVVPVDLFGRLCGVAREHGLLIHLDGARIFNAAIAAGVPVTEYTRQVDSLMFCLSKGLSCPLGSVLCGSRQFIEKADRCRKRIGGGMRQAGIIAAAGVVALDTMIDRLAEDHANAKRLAKALQGIPKLRVNIEEVESNMVLADHSATGLTTPEFVDLLKSHGVLVADRPPRQVRMVTHRHHNADLIDEAAARIRRAMRAIAGGKDVIPAKRAKGGRPE
jgi:threonine aldolase